MSLAGLGQQLASAVVGIRYEVNVDQAKAAIKGLAGEQKKAAKETAEAYKQQSESFNKHVADFGKGAAIIGGAILVARSGLKAYGEDVRLTAGSSKVNIDALSESWDGLKTRVELMTLAQAGNRGAWKLTTGQLQLVTDGMRALEKQGFDSQKVFDRFTEVLKKGKLEGLDEFGLSVKATGDQTKDLQVLMRALGQEVTEVGGNFTKAGDDASRAMVRIEDGFSRLRIAAGQATTAFLDAGVALGNVAGVIFGGRLSDEQRDSDEDRMVNSRARAYETRFGNVRDSRYLFSGEGQSRGFQPQDATDAKALSDFASRVKRSLDGKGPLATSSPAELARMIAGLPSDWRAVDAELGKRVDELTANLSARMAAGMVRGLVGPKGNPAGAPAGAPKSRRGRGAGVGESIGPGLIFGALDSAIGAVDNLAAQRDARQAGDRLSQSMTDAAANAAFFAAMGDARGSLGGLQGAFGGVTTADNLNAAERESFLERNFGKIEEFEAYGRAFDTLASVGGAAWSAMYDVLIAGEGDMGEAVKKAIGVALGAKAKELGAEGMMAMLRGAAYSVVLDPRGPPLIGAGAAMMAGAVAVGAIASQIGGGSAGGVSRGAGSAAGVGRREINYDHRPVSTSVIVGDSMGDDSPRERARRTRRAMNSAHHYGAQARGVRRE